MEYFIAGVFAQTVLFGSTFTGDGRAEDTTKGIIDGFRSQPMSKSAVLFGRTASDVVYNLTSTVVMTITGLIVGWRIHTGPLQALQRVPAAAPVRVRRLLGDGVGPA